MAEKVISIIIRGDAKSATRAFESVGVASKGAATNVGKADKGFVSAAKSVAKFAAAGVAVAGFGRVLSGVVSDALEYQKSLNEVGAVIKATGGAAHVTQTAAKDLAGSLESLSGVDENLILQGEKVMLTFRGVRNEAGKGNDIFTQATKVALDMSVVMKQDMSQSALLVGKALQDPVRGLGALRRVGVQFTTSQESQIKKLVQSGKTMQAQKIILGELRTEFGGAAKASGDTFAGALARLQDHFLDMGRDAVTKALPALTRISGWLLNKGIPAVERFVSQGVKELATQLSGVGRSAGPALAQIGQGMANLWRVAGPLLGAGLKVAMMALVAAFRILGALLFNVIAPAFAAVTGWLARHKTLVQSVAIFIGVMTLALKAQSVAMAIWAAVTGKAKLAIEAFKDAQIALNAAMRANLVGIIITAIIALVAALIYAYNHSQTFRRIVQAAFHGVAVAAGAVWSALKVAFNGIVAAIRWVGNAGVWLWHNVFQPVWNGIKFAVGIAAGFIRFQISIIAAVFRGLAAVGMWLWRNVFVHVWHGIMFAVKVAAALISVPIALMRLAFRGLGVIANWLWHNVFQPVWRGIVAAARWAWGILRGVFAVFRAGINNLAGWARWLWHTIFAPVWRGIVAAFRWAWGIARGVFAQFRLGINAIANVARWLWQHIMVPVWRGIVRAVSTAWTGLNRIFGWVKKGIGFVANSFKSNLKNIQNWWNKLKQVASAPVRFVVNTVYNNWIRSLWKKIVGWLPGVKQLPAMTVHKDGGIVNYAGGGVNAANTGRERHVAQIAKPGEWRVWAEPETGGEAYIPLGKDKRSRSEKILTAVAHNFGYSLTKMANGGITPKVGIKSFPTLNFSGAGSLPGALLRGFLAWLTRPVGGATPVVGRPVTHLVRIAQKAVQPLVAPTVAGGGSLALSGGTFAPRVSLRSSSRLGLTSQTAHNVSRVRNLYRRDDGSAARPGDFLPVGLNGPELYQTGSSGGRVIPNDVAFGTPNEYITVNVNVGKVIGNRNELAQEVVSAVTEFQRKGGKIPFVKK